MPKSESSFLVSARKYRPLQFKDVHGQDHVTRTLANAVSRNRVAHAYLLCGPRGVGKTTVARILARAFNCERGPEDAPCNECDACRTILQGRCVDVLEIDAASNTGVDNIRDLRENARLPPAQVRCKTYIIDEVHRLSGPAFDALLKILEEPPEHVRFIFATTEVHKVPSTILSRCQRFTFHRVPTHVIVQHLEKILDDQKDVQVPAAIREEMLFAIARSADGAMRDALSLFDQVLSFCGEDVNMEDVRTVLGLVSFQSLAELVDTIIAGDIAGAIRGVHAIVESGRDPAQLAQDLINFYRDLMVANVTSGECQDIVDLPQDDFERLVARSNDVRPNDALRAAEILWEATRRMSFDPDPLLVLEVAVSKIAVLGRSVAIDDLIARINKLQQGPAPAFPATQSPAPPEASAAVAQPPARAAAAAGSDQSNKSDKSDKSDLSDLSDLSDKSDHPNKPVTSDSSSAIHELPITEPDETVTVYDMGGPAETVASAPEPVTPEPAAPQLATPEPSTPEPSPPQHAADVEAAIRACWSEVVDIIKGRNPSLGFTLADVQPLRIDGSFLVLGIPLGMAWYEELLTRADHASLISTLISERVGRAFAISVQESDEVQVHTPAGDEQPPPEQDDPYQPPQPVDPTVLLREEPLIQRVLDMFEGKIESIRPA